MTGHGRVYASINLDAAEHNFELMHQAIGPETRMIAVIKTDGYGHGAKQIAHLVEAYPYIWGFATASVEEAMELRRDGITKPILVLGFTFREDYEIISKFEIRPTVFKLSMAEELSEAARRTGREIKIHFALDTGMSRIGFAGQPSDIETIKRITGLPGLQAEGLFTHFARADEADKASAREQLRRFIDFSRRLEAAGIRIPLQHCSNSAAIMELPEAHLNLVRAGITIYGIYPSDEVCRDAMPFEPVMELKSHIAFIKTVGPGTEVSYGGTFVTDRTTRIATIPVGYGDGYPRSLSNRGYVLIRGRRAPILGRVCMDQFMVDVTDIEAEELDTVTLMGRDGDAELSVDELGKLSGRFPYEFVCYSSKRIPRVYVRS